MIAMVDDDNSGQIEFAEFLKVVESHQFGGAGSGDDGDTIAAFVAMGGAQDKTGFVEAAKLRQTIKDFGLTIDIDGLLQQYDNDNSGKIEYSEFKAMLQLAHTN